MNPKLILCLQLVLGGLFAGCSTSSSPVGNERGSSKNDWQTKNIASAADLDRVVAQLQNPATRFDAFQDLLEFAGYPQGNTQNNDLKADDLHEKAIHAMHGCPGLDAVVAAMIDRLNNPDERVTMLRGLLEFGRPGLQMLSTVTSTGDCSLDALINQADVAANSAFDVPTVEKALGDTNWLLRITAVDFFGNSMATKNEWKRLLPQIEKLAVEGDSAIRRDADASLNDFPGTEEFLAGRLTNETSAVVILELLPHRRVGSGLNGGFLTLFVPLLSHPDEKVREDALIFVGFNSSRAPMWQFTFGTDVLDRVIASTHAKSAKERAAAAYALSDLRQLDPDRSRETFLKLVNDPDPDVRWRVAWGLAGQYQRADVQQAIAALLKDKSPIVRFETIEAFGPRKCIPQLEVLAKGPDSEAARSAAEKLKQLTEEDKQLRLKP